MKGIKQYLDKQPVSTLLRACNDIYEWNYITGSLNKYSVVHLMAKETNMTECDIADEIVRYASFYKFDKVVKLLMLETPYMFIDTKSKEETNGNN